LFSDLVEEILVPVFQLGDELLFVLCIVFKILEFNIIFLKLILRHLSLIAHTI